MCGWVVVVANNGQHVDPVIKVGVWWTDDRSVPVGERLVVTLIQSVGHALIGELGVFGLLELFVESEGSRHSFHFVGRSDIININYNQVCTFAFSIFAKIVNKKRAL